MAPEVKSNSSVNRLAALTFLLLTLVSWLASNRTQASQSFTVTNTNDSGAGSLRQAILDANALAGTDTIVFQIGSGVQTITPLSPLPIITDPVIIDGTTQPGFAGTPIIELNGTSAGSNAAGLQINSGDSTIKGLVINRFRIGIYLQTKGNNVITGNYVGTNVAGTAALGNKSHGINVESASGNKFGGTTPAERNIISGNGNNGLRLSGSSQNIVQGNYIGTDVTGNVDLGNANQGMRIDNAFGNKIGGTGAGEGNIISGNSDVALRISNADNNSVIGNRIGVSASGAGNLGNDAGGVHVFGGTGNQISSNSISFNGALGIDLDVDQIAPDDGITPNDAGDADIGSNNLQNFPIITDVQSSGGQTTIQGTLNSKANTQFHLEFYANSQCDPSGYGEGQTLLGATDVTTVGNDASFNVSLPVTVLASQFVTATATDPSGNTSEFSKCAAPGAGAPQQPALLISDVSKNEGTGGTTDFVFNVTLTAVSNQTVTVNYATIAGGTATPGADYQTTNGLLTFNPGETVKPVTIKVVGDALQETFETFIVQLSNSVNATIDKAQGTGTILDDDFANTTFQFSQTSYSVQEDQTSATITITRAGDTASAMTVDYATVDKTALQTNDYTIATGTLKFGAGETSQIFQVLINEDSYTEGDEQLDIVLSSPSAGAALANPATATLTIVDDAQESSANVIDDAEIFVSQHYHDFLGREPDAPGLAFWTNNITKCVDPAQRFPGQTLEECIDKQRVTTSGAFFLSPEFQYTGYYILRVYKGSLGEMPAYTEFMRDLRQVTAGIIVNNQLSAAAINQNKADFAAQFVNRAKFKAKYDALSDEQYVDELFKTTGINASTDDRAALVNGLKNNSETRATVLQKVVDGVHVIAEGNQQFNTTYGKAFYDQEFNNAFVEMEYFGYLRRDPDAPGYAHWLGKLNFYGNYIDAEMVRSFIVSPEYRHRFGQ